MFWFKRILLLGLMVASANASAELDIETEQWFSFTLDNDLFVGSDGGYTNGFYLSWYDVNQIAKPEQLQQLDIPWYFKLQYKLAQVDDSQVVVKIHNLGQIMVTPSDIEQTPPNPNDIPYAGALIWQGSIITANDNYSDFVTLLLGVVGPLSLAEDSQKLVHKITGSTEPKGWDYQLKNELVFALGFSRNWRLWDANVGVLEVDFVGGANVEAGTFNSGVDISGHLRIGKALASSYPTLALANSRESNPIAHSRGYFAYIGVGGGYEFNSIFADGNTFRDSPSIDLDGEKDALHLGVAFSGENWGFTISIEKFGVLSKQGEGQQKFGSFSILYRL